MAEKVHFTLPGHPKGKGRARAFRRGDFIGHYTPEETRSYEGMIRLAAKRAMAGRLPFARAVVVHIAAVFDVPGGYPKKRRKDCLEGAEFPAKTPDLDNIVKAITDGCNGVVFKDDKQIVSGRFSKVYGPAPLIAVTVTEL